MIDEAIGIIEKEVLVIPLHRQVIPWVSRSNVIAHPSLRQQVRADLGQGQLTLSTSGPASSSSRFAAALAQWLVLGDAEVFKRIIDGTFDSARTGVMDIALPLAGVMTLWLGILAVGEKAGAHRRGGAHHRARSSRASFPACRAAIRRTA